MGELQIAGRSESQHMYPCPKTFTGLGRDALITSYAASPSDLTSPCREGCDIVPTGLFFEGAEEKLCLH